jgi:O-succinylhomoserine sulfhydrylase
LLSGVETLFVRTKAEADSALRIAQWLQKEPKIDTVYYAGLPEHPQADLVAKQQANGGFVMAFEVKGGVKAACTVIDQVQLFSKTANFGDVRSTITHPWTTTHCRMSPEDKLAAGIKEGLIRIAIGLEHTDDLIADLKQALNAI